MKSVLVFLVLVASILAAPTVQPPSETLTATCAVDVNSALADGINDRVKGTVTLTQVNGGHTTIKISLSGFDTKDAYTIHGFHIHASGDLTRGCNSMGGHYNPKNVNHSASNSPIRHYGDLGNIQEDADGKVEKTITDNQVSLIGTYSVINRGVVIHQKADDLGLGGDAGSLANGNAGSRIACCVITSGVVTRGTDAPSTTSMVPTRGTAPPATESTTTTTTPQPTTTTTIAQPDTTTTPAQPSTPGHIDTTTNKVPTAKPKNILDVAKDADATAFLDLVDISTLKEKLSGEGPFTLFVPTNDAIADARAKDLERIIAIPDLLDAFLGYHVGVGKAMSSSLYNEQLVDSVAEQKIRMNIYNIDNSTDDKKSSYTLVTATGAPVTKVDLEASNGVVHVVDKVMFPAPRGSIAEEMALTKEFSKMSAVLLLTETGQKFEGKGNFTFFAPTDKAVGKLGSKEWERIIRNIDILESVLRFHSVNQTFHDAALQDNAKLYSFDNDEITITEVIGEKDINKLANGAPIKTNLQLPTTNGVIHGIDTFMNIPLVDYLEKFDKH